MKIYINNPTSKLSYSILTNSTATMIAVCRKVTSKNIILTIQKMVRNSMGRLTEGYTWRRRNIYGVDVMRLTKEAGVRNSIRAHISVLLAAGTKVLLIY